MFQLFAAINGWKVWAVALGLVLLLPITLSLRLPATAAASGTCIDDVTGTTNNCTANDVVISELVNRDSISCTAGDMVTVYLRADLLAGASERYDIGMFVATDGGEARTGACYQDYLPPPLANIDSYNPGSPLPGPGGGPFYNGEEDTDPADTCGDLENGAHTYYDLAPGTGISVPCVDSDRDGYLDIGTCVSWDNTENNTCTSVNQAVPNTKAKCRCALVRVGNVTVEPGEIRVTKTADPTTMDEPGGTGTFTFLVENPSEASITLESLTDSVFGNLTTYPGSTCSAPQVLAPLGSYSCSIPGAVSGQPGLHTNEVTATGTDEYGNPLRASDPAEVAIQDLQPLIAVIKSANPESVVEPGASVVYTVRVTNNSVASDPVTLTGLVDNVYGNLVDAGNAAISNSTCSLVTIQPGNTYQCTFEAQVSGVGGGQVTDIVTATGRDDEQNPAQASDDAVVTITAAPQPVIAVIKTVSPETVMEPGDTVLYTVQVNNNSPAGVPVTLTGLTDSIYGNLVGGGNAAISNSTCILATIQPGGSYICTFQALVAGSGGGQVTDIVTATALAQSGKQARASDDATVVITSTPIPRISVDKWADPTTVIEPGGTVKYTVRVRNDSPIGVPMTLTSLQDNVYGNLVDAGNARISGSTCALVTIQPGDTYQCTFYAAVSGEPGEKVVDVVTATGRDPRGTQVSAADDATVTIVAEPPDTGVDLPAPFIFGLLAGFGIALVAVGTWIGRRAIRSE